MLKKKRLQYGCQLVLAKGTDKAVLSVYNGKKGIKFVWNGKNCSIYTSLQRYTGRRKQHRHKLLPAERFAGI